MTLAEFKERYRVKDVKDGCDDRIIPGRLPKDAENRPENRNHVFEVDGRFAAYFNLSTRGRWNSVRKRLVAAGGSPAIVGECDGFVNFDSTNEPLTRLVLKLAGVRVRRQLSEEQRAKLRERLTKVRP